MDNTTSMQAQHKLGFLHQIRLVPLFSSILGGILLLFALSSGLASYFLMQADRDQRRADLLHCLCFHACLSFLPPQAVSSSS